MRLLLFCFFSICISTNIIARVVEFSVNMNNEAVSVNGIHVSGDFQQAAGFSGGNWNPASTVLTQIGTTGIYHRFVNIPAKKKYEYKYVNGDQFYEVEFVPDESRVGYLFNDNRWFYLDSLANDTLKLPAVIFSTNAPLTKKLLRYKVGMSGFTVSADGVHVAGTHNTFNTENSYMYSFDGKVYEYLAYYDTLAPFAEFKFVNGKTTGNYETVPVACNFTSNRKINFTRDTVMPVVCFNSCGPCVNGMAKYYQTNSFSLQPNPLSSNAILEFDGAIADAILFNAQGKLVRIYKQCHSGMVIEKGDLTPGIYFLNVTAKGSLRFVVE